MTACTAAAFTSSFPRRLLPTEQDIKEGRGEWPATEKTEWPIWLDLMILECHRPGHPILVYRSLPQEDRLLVLGGPGVACAIGSSKGVLRRHVVGRLLIGRTGEGRVGGKISIDD